MPPPRATGSRDGPEGSVVVDPADPGYGPAVDRDLALTLDDLLVEEGHVAASSRSGPTSTAIGRFGHVLLVNGGTPFTTTAAVGEVVRLFLVDTADTRLFDIGLRGARRKLVGGDSGRTWKQTFVDHVLLVPSERPSPTCSSRRSAGDRCTPCGRVAVAVAALARAAGRPSRPTRL